jgi:hypothetical protein
MTSNAARKTRKGDKTMTITSQNAVKWAAQKYLAAYLAGDDCTCRTWFVKWVVLTRRFEASVDRLWNDPLYHDLCCNDA